jgi:polyhydroxyalkanoate synthase
MDMPTPRPSRLRDALKTSLEISRAWNQALRDRALSPYPYLAPIVQRAARIADPPVNPTPHRTVYTRGSMRLLRFEPRSANTRPRSCSSTR